MAEAFRSAIVECGPRLLLGALTVLFLLIRRRGVQIALLVPLCLSPSFSDAAQVSARLALVLAAVTMSGSGIASPTPSPSHATSPVMASAGLALARLIYPRTLNSAIDDYTFSNVVTPTYHADADLKRLEADHPGIIDAIVAAIRPEFEKGRIDALPSLWAITGAIYAQSLTLVELRQAVAFYESPVGRRLELLEEAAVIHAAPPAGDKLVLLDTPGPSRDDSDAKRLFETTPAGRKLAALQPRIGNAIAAWNDAPTPSADARINGAIAKAVERFTEPFR